MPDILSPRALVRRRLVVRHTSGALWTCSLVAVITACTSDPITASAKRLQTLTVPPGAKGFPVLLSRTQYAVQASWVVETERSWTDYSDWLQLRLGRQFDVVRATDGGLTFRRVASGDVFTLDVQPIAANPALRVRFQGPNDFRDGDARLELSIEDNEMF